ncbi:hypothetical protein [Synechococcus sp. MIT S9509]|uniref:hypothetical protein n=1 Tax=Synechococcus sp. MIT S9509 TaxID=1801630 RepID=UPI0012E893D8|nr:hypothetical protein [Synechococcus sp. MIT S9509]
MVRNLRTVAGLKPSQIAFVRFVSNLGNLAHSLKQRMAEIMLLIKAETVQFMMPSEVDAASVLIALIDARGEFPVLLSIDGLVVFDDLKARLEKAILYNEWEIQGHLEQFCL